MFSNNMIGKSMLITYAKMGINIDDFRDTNGGVVFLFTVPASSYIEDSSGKEMSGKHLASRVKNTLESMGIKFSDIRYGIRNEYWDKDKESQAEIEIYKELGYKDWQIPKNKYNKYS